MLRIMCVVPLCSSLHPFTALIFSQLLAMKRVGVLRGGAPHGIEDKDIPPSQRFKIARYNELTSYGSSTAYSDGEGMLG